jgi:hypothetical protein
VAASRRAVGNRYRPDRRVKHPRAEPAPADFGTMPPTRSSMQDLDAVAVPRVPRQARIELACLLRGDMVGISLDHHVIRPRVAGSVRVDEQTMRYGRCGRPVATGERRDDDAAGPGRPR